jgi:hypothetical protein
MGYQEHEHTYERMHDITTRFLAVVNYGGNMALPICPCYPKWSSNSASSGRLYQASSSSSRPPFPATLLAPSFVLHPPMHS